jgi:hypothetical protein
MKRVLRVVLTALASLAVVRFGVWATGENIRFAYFRYTANDGTFWSVRADADYGALANSGLGAFVQADPMWPSGPRWRRRQVSFVDPTTGLLTSRVLGTAGAGFGVAGTVYTSVVRGSAGTIAYTSRGIIDEKRPKTKPIIPVVDTTTT